MRRGRFNHRVWATLAIAVSVLLVTATQAFSLSAPWGRLGTVRVGPYRGKTVFERGPGHRGGLHPCFLSGFATSANTSIFGYSGPPGCGLPYIDRAVNGPSDKMLLALAFRKVVQVHLELAKEDPTFEDQYYPTSAVEDVPLRFLSERLAARTHVRRFHYALVVLIGMPCVHRIDGFNAQGVQIFEATDTLNAPCVLPGQAPGSA